MEKESQDIAFEGNDIKLPHHSASTINSFISNRRSFVLNKLLRRVFTPNPNMARGSAVESVVNEYFKSRADNSYENVDWENPEQVVALAHKFYDRELQDYYSVYSPSEKEIEVRNSVGALAILALNHYKETFMAIPILQHKFEAQLPGTTIPIIGYLDYYRPGKVIRDLKVVGQRATYMPIAHTLTASVYKFAHPEVIDVIYDYAVNNKKPVMHHHRLEEEDYEFGLSYAIAAAKVLEEMQFCQDQRRMMEITMGFPDMDSLYNPRERMQAAEEYGIKLPTRLKY